MSQYPGLIRALPKEVAEQIKSSTTISSLCQVVCGLLENALEAQADVIDISVDFQLGSCILEDNGVGIPPNEFEANGGLCKPYHTSKFNDGFETRCRFGTFLASLASLSTITVTSHHHAHESHSTLILHHSRPAARLVPAPAHHILTHRAHGTKVAIRDLFGALPVRVKHRTLSRELPSVRQKDWHLLRHAVTGILLAWTVPVFLTMKTPDDAQKVHFGKGSHRAGKSADSVKPDRCSFDIDSLRGIIVQGGQCEPDSWETWSKISARTLDLTIRAIISNQPAPSKICQFISIENSWMSNESGSNVLYDAINKVFACSSFGVDEELAANDTQQLRSRKMLRHEIGDHTHKELKGRSKGIDKWPMFYVRIESHHSYKLSYLRTDDISPEGGKILQSIAEILSSMMTKFLSEQHYRVHARRSRNKELTLQNSELSSRSGSTRRQDHKHVPRNRSTSCSRRDPVSLDANHPGSLTSCNVGKKRSGNGHGGDEFGSAIILPKPPTNRGLGFEDSFGGWSRIKAARPVEAFLSSKVPLERAQTAATKPSYDGDAGAPAGESVPSDRSASEDGTLRAPKSHVSQPICQNGTESGDREASDEARRINTDLEPQVENHTGSDFDGDRSLPWTNPVTKAKVIINSRTGLLMADCSRPATPFTATDELLAKPHKRLAKSLKLQRGKIKAFGIPPKDTWAHEFLDLWDNPVFSRNEENIKQISLDTLSEQTGQILSGKLTNCTYHEIERAFNGSSAAIAAKISSRSLGDATVLGQIDKKFILLKAASSPPTKCLDGAGTTFTSHLLVLVDQHAADERHGVETLFKDLCSPPSRQTRELRTSTGLSSAIETVRLTKPITIEFAAHETELFKHYIGHFANWGILLDIVPQVRKQPNPQPRLVATRIQVLSLPPSIAERCRSDPKHLSELLRGEVWRLEETGSYASVVLQDPYRDTDPENWLHRIRTCPPSILDMLNSRSCRSAIMFNDQLTHEECEVLVQRLARCHFPFQCAHGRPTMVPLVDLGAADNEVLGDVGMSAGRSLFASDRSEEADVDFVDAWKRWKAREASADAEDR